MSGNENKEVEQQSEHNANLDRVSKTLIVNMKTEDYDEYIGRAGRGKTGYYGNPFDVRKFGREGSLRRYQEYFLDRIENEYGFKQKILDLRGKKLGCFCKPRRCHGDVIVAWLEQYDEDLINRARKEGSRPKPEAISAASRSHLIRLARKLNPEPIITPMMTDSEKSQHIHEMKQRQAIQEF